MGVWLTSKLSTLSHFLASVRVKVPQGIVTIMNRGARLSVEVPIPVEGMTITMWRIEGSATLHASKSMHNPNSAFYDYKIVDEGELFVESLHDRQKRQIEEGSNNTLLFVSVEGHENGTHFHLNTSVGNTIEIGECMMLQFKRTPMLKASHTNSL